MSIAEKLTAIAENEPKVYQAGKQEGYTEGQQAAYDSFWADITSNWKRTIYMRAFSYWGAEYIRPARQIVPTTQNSATGTFVYCSRLKKLESQGFDFSQKTRSTSASYAYSDTFYNCSALEEIEDIGMQADYHYSYTFGNCPNLRTIAAVRTDAATKWVKAFDGCKSLENLNIIGTIGQNGFNVSVCPLTHESLMSIINALEEKTSGTFSVTLGATNLAKLTDAEKALATEKGWTLA